MGKAMRLTIEISFVERVLAIERGTFNVSVFAINRTSVLLLINQV